MQKSASIQLRTDRSKFGVRVPPCGARTDTHARLRAVPPPGSAAAGHGEKVELCAGVRGDPVLDRVHGPVVPRHLFGRTLFRALFGKKGLDAKNKSGDSLCSSSQNGLRRFFRPGPESSGRHSIYHDVNGTSTPPEGVRC